VTTLEPLKGFYAAEAYHQNYACQNPNQPYISHIALPKVEKVRSKYKDLVKPQSPIPANDVVSVKEMWHGRLARAFLFSVIN